MKHHIREMKIEDYEKIDAFWKSYKGLNIDDSDSYENVKMYLKRNKKLCYIAVAGDTIIRTIKCGQDGRRGYMHHLAVDGKFRKRGIGKELINRSLKSLKEQGISKCNTFVLDANQAAIDFWQHQGWKRLDYNYRTLQIDIWSVMELSSKPPSGLVLSPSTMLRTGLSKWGLGRVNTINE